MAQPKATAPGVLVIGGGAAGLVAARVLAQAGRGVVLLEGRDRLGGRIHPVGGEALPQPVELGAEFIHGRPAAAWDLIRRFGLVAVDLPDDHRARQAAGRLERGGGFFDSMTPVFAPMREHHGRGKPDASFAAFLRRHIEPRMASLDGDERRRLVEARDRAVAFVEGFDAADPERVSANSLADELGGLGDVGGEPQFKLLGGYGGLVDALAAEARAAGADLRLGCRVERLTWSRGRVAAHLAGGSELTAHAAVITVPVGILHLVNDDPAGLRFEPDVPRVRAAARRLGAGPVVKVVLAFRTPFWEDDERVRGASEGSLFESYMWHDPGADWPTWWTALPMRVPVLTAWAGGPKAAALTGWGEAGLVHSALDHLASLLRQDRGWLAGEVVGARAHDWLADPLARGAYSYVEVGGDGARVALAEPVESTLFFAGEACDTEGQASTVAGALASGARAAAAVIDAVCVSL